MKALFSWVVMPEMTAAGGGHRQGDYLRFAAGWHHLCMGKHQSQIAAFVHVGRKFPANVIQVTDWLLRTAQCDRKSTRHFTQERK